MAQAPRDYTDLFLAPVALRVDARLADFAELNRDQLHERVVLASGRQASQQKHRSDDVVASVTQLLDMHGWTASWGSRGIQLSHGDHSLVLGIPRNIAEYVAELQ